MIAATTLAKLFMGLHYVRLFLVFCMTGPPLVVLAETNRAGGQTLYYVPHTHWEGAVFKTREEYLEMGLPNILKALALLKKYPDYKFTLDQVAYFRPLLERYPEEAAAFRKFVGQGRLEIVGGMDVMPDDVKPGGELFVRQMQYGKRYCREELGVDVSVAWLLDTFGHNPQLPQLLKLAGFKSFWFCRGVPSKNLPSEFFWRGIDGSTIPAFWLPGFYGLFYGPPREPAAFTKFFEQRFNSLNSHAREQERVGLAGVDVSEPEDYVPPLVEQFNQRPDARFRIRYSVPSEFAAVVARRKDLPVMSGDYNPIFPGTYSSRIELKQATREIEQELLTAEKLSVLASWQGAPSEREMIWRAWEPVLFNQTHDLASGVMTDHVYEDVKRGYDFSKKLAEEIIDRAWEKFVAQIDTAGQGKQKGASRRGSDPSGAGERDQESVPVVVFNPLSWVRTDVAKVEVGFANLDARGIEVRDVSGQGVPFQMEAEKYGSGGIKRAKLQFIARDIPALGYSVYQVVSKREAGTSSTAMETDKVGNAIENEHVRVTFNRSTGEITSIFDKEAGWEGLSGSGNVVSREQDKGDLWELYRGLNGGSYIAMTNRQAVPKDGAAQLSNEYSAQESFLGHGPVFSEFRVSHPLTNGSFSTLVRLYARSRRLEISTELVNNEKYVRYQAQFPTSIRNGRNVQEIPFGAIERPEGIEFPAQHWVDYSDGSHGVALLNFGMPGNLVSDGTLLLSLMRSHNLGAYGFGGGYEPGMSSESGFQLGKLITFHYALAPHSGDWRQARVYRDGLEFNHPLIARKTTAHPGKLQAKWGLLEIKSPNVVLTALNPGANESAILRVYEASGEAKSNVRIQLHAKVTSAHEANLLEDAGQKLAVRRGEVEFSLHPFEVKTLKFELAPWK